MASVKKITMREYNGTDYDTLYPKTIASQVDGVYNKTEVDALLANKAPSNIAAYSDIEIAVNDGESIQEAINSIPQNLNGHCVNVSVYGSHTENVNIYGFSGYPWFYISLINGASLTGTITVYGAGKIDIRSFGTGTSMITNTSGGVCIESYGGGIVWCSNLSLTTTGDIAVMADYSSRLSISGGKVKATGSGNRTGAIFATHQSEVTVNDTTIESGTTCGLAAQYTSLVRFYGTNNATTKSATYAGSEVVILT